MEASHWDGWRTPGGIMRLFIPPNGNRESSGGDCAEPCEEFLWAVTFLQGSSLYWLYTSFKSASYAHCGCACISACGVCLYVYVHHYNNMYYTVVWVQSIYSRILLKHNVFVFLFSLSFLWNSFILTLCWISNPLKHWPTLVTYLFPFPVSPFVYLCCVSHHLSIFVTCHLCLTLLMSQWPINCVFSMGLDTAKLASWKPGL